MSDYNADPRGARAPDSATAMPNNQKQAVRNESPQSDSPQPTETGAHHNFQATTNTGPGQVPRSSSSRPKN